MSTISPINGMMKKPFYGIAARAVLALIKIEEIAEVENYTVILFSNKVVNQILESIQLEH